MAWACILEVTKNLNNDSGLIENQEIDEDDDVYLEPINPGSMDIMIENSD